jgi:hypothetical protein
MAAFGPGEDMVRMFRGFGGLCGTLLTTEGNLVDAVLDRMGEALKSVCHTLILLHPLSADCLLNTHHCQSTCYPRRPG